MQWSGGGDGIENDRLALSGDLGWSENTGEGQPRVGILDWGGISPPSPTQGTSGSTWRHFWSSQLKVEGAAGFWSVEVRDAGSCPSTYRSTSPHRVRDDPATNVNLGEPD